MVGEMMEGEMKVRWNTGEAIWIRTLND